MSNCTSKNLIGVNLYTNSSWSLLSLNHKQYFYTYLRIFLNRKIFLTFNRVNYNMVIKKLNEII